MRPLPRVQSPGEEDDGTSPRQSEGRPSRISAGGGRCPKDLNVDGRADELETVRRRDASSHIPATDIRSVRNELVRPPGAGPLGLTIRNAKGRVESLPEIAHVYGVDHGLNTDASRCCAAQDPRLGLDRMDDVWPEPPEYANERSRRKQIANRMWLSDQVGNNDDLNIAEELPDPPGIVFGADEHDMLDVAAGVTRDDIGDTPFGSRGEETRVDVDDARHRRALIPS
jgi:hypothetical protein